MTYEPSKPKSHAMSDHDASIQRWAEFRRENADLRAKLHERDVEIARLRKLCWTARVNCDPPNRGDDATA
jgi:hypothetical protein